MDLCNRHLILDEQNRNVVDLALLDEIIGKELDNKRRKMKIVYSEMLAGTDMAENPREYISSVKRHKARFHSVCIPTRVMQLLLLRGIKELPLNEPRITLVKVFFGFDLGHDPYTPFPVHGLAPPPAQVVTAPPAQVVTAPPAQVVTAPPAQVVTAPPAQVVTAPPAQVVTAPPAQVVTAPPAHERLPIIPAIITRDRDRTQEQFRRNVTRWGTTMGGAQFWKQVFRFANSKKITVQSLVLYLQGKALVRTRQSRKGSVNIIKTLIYGLLTKRGTMRNFCDDLAIATRTGNMETLIQVIRERISVTGLHCKIVPCISNVKVSTAALIVKFISICRPERTYSGFRVDIVAALRFVAFALLKTTNLRGLQVNITSLVFYTIVNE